MTDTDLVARARDRDRDAFDALVARHVGPARRAVRRLVGHPDEVDELVQEALLKAWRSVDRFRGEASFGTWLVQIASRTALDHLRTRRRWRAEAQVIYAQACRADARLAGEVGAALHDPTARFDVHEHVAFCFSCVARTLPPDQQVAVVLRDAVGLGNADGARAAGLSRGAFRHALADGRAALTARFEGLCALVNKQGVCWQCEGLRAAAPADRRGPPAPSLAGDDADARYAARAALVGDADPDGDPCRGLHDLFFRRIGEIEEAQAGSFDAAAAAACRPDGTD